MKRSVGIGFAASLGVILATIPAQTFRSSGPTLLRAQLVGTWELVSTEDHLKDGSTRSYPDSGPHGKGFLIYTADGYMCAQLMNPDRPPWKDEDRPTDAEKISAYDGFSSYCGPYEVDEAQGVVYHIPKTASFPGYVGTRQRRPASLSGDLLTFADKVSDEPSVESYVIVWRKVRSAVRR